MNRRERRAAAKKGDVITIGYGRIQERDQTYQMPVECYLCGTTHKAANIARIEDKRSITHVPLCEACLASDGLGDAVFRKWCDAPDVVIHEGGEATIEQVNALADKQRTTEH